MSASQEKVAEGKTLLVFSIINQRRLNYIVQNIAYRLKPCDIDIADVFPQPMEGYKLMVNKGLSNHFQVSHSLQLSGMGPGSYHFAATYVGSKQISPTEVCVPFSTLYHLILKITVHIQYQEEKYWQLVAFCLLV